MELSGGFGIGRQYVAVAFSRHPEMKDADLYYCNGRQLTSGVIRELSKTPIDLQDEVHLIPKKVHENLKTLRGEFDIRWGLPDFSTALAHAH